jgi:ABC-type uncharacterized transport system substrate-binding protein
MGQKWKLIFFAVLLLLSCSKKGLDGQYKIGLLQFASRQTVDDAARGVLDALKEAGYQDGVNCRIDHGNAQNDFSTAQSIAQKFVAKRMNIIITLTTPCLQVTAAANQLIPHVFGMVTDPFRMGIADDSVHHRENITGIATFQPVDEMLTLIQQVFPKVRKIGVIWNPTEACSEACVELMRKGCQARQLDLIDVTVTNSNEVFLAAQSLAEKKVELIFISGDNTVELAIETVIAAANESHIPVVTNNPPHAEMGAVLALGADYYTVGQETGKLAIRVIEGAHPADIPIRSLVPQALWINRSSAQRFGIEIPTQLLRKANHIID